MADTTKTWDDTHDESLKKFSETAQNNYDNIAQKNTETTNTYINDMNAVVDANTQRATEKVENQIEAVPQQYQSGYDMNAIQQKINERQVAEKMANLGLTNSGLSRTQQTAINVQRSNADAALTRQKNATISSLRSQIADIVAEAASQKNSFAAEAKYNTNMQNNSLYSTLMQNAEQNAINRADTVDNQNFQANEAQKDRDFTSQENQKSRDFTAGENQKDRDYEKYVDDRAFDYQVERDSVEDQHWQDSFDYQKSRDTVEDEKWNKNYTLQKNSSTTDEVIKAIKKGKTVSYDEDADEFVIDDEEETPATTYETPTKDVYLKAVAKYIALGADKGGDAEDEFLDYLEENFSGYDLEAVVNYVGTFEDSTTKESTGGLNWGLGVDKNASVKDSYNNIYTMKELYDALDAAGYSNAKTWVEEYQTKKGLTW